MVPKVHRYASSELGITSASRCSASWKTYVPTQRKRRLGKAARKKDSILWAEEFLTPAHKAQRQECALKPSHRGGKWDDNVRDFIIQPGKYKRHLQLEKKQTRSHQQESTCQARKFLARKFMARKVQRMGPTSLETVVQEDCSAAETSTSPSLQGNPWTCKTKHWRSAQDLLID